MDDFVLVNDNDWEFGAHTLSETHYSSPDIDMIFVLGQVCQYVFKEGKELAFTLDAIFRQFHSIL